MGMLVVVSALVLFLIIVALFVFAVRSDSRTGTHRWLVFIPLLVAIGWLIDVLVTG